MAKVANGNAKHGSKVILLKDARSALAKATDEQKAAIDWEYAEFKAGTVLTVKEFARRGTTTYVIPVENDRADIPCQLFNLFDGTAPAPVATQKPVDMKKFRAAARKLGMSVRTHSIEEIQAALAAPAKRKANGDPLFEIPGYDFDADMASRH